MPERIRLTHRPQYLALSPDGKKLFATEAHGRTLSIIDTASATVRRTLTLPHDIYPLAATASGLLYIGSLFDGLFVLDIANEELLPGGISTGGPVWDIAATPDGGKLFLAMSNAGLKSLSTQSRRLRTVSDRICPEHLAMDSAGKRLYVSYQCSGPMGRRGHDSMEVFDVEKEVSLGIVTGPPMVGGAISTSPDGRLVVIDGRDACRSSDYDHEGCPAVPSHVYYLIRASDRLVLHQFAFSVTPHSDGYGRPYFLDDSRFLILGDSVLVVDAAKYTVLERSDVRPGGSDAVAFSPDGRRAWIGESGSNSVAVIDLDGADCSPPSSGLSMYFPADGTNEDSGGGTVLNARGSLRFAPAGSAKRFFWTEPIRSQAPGPAIFRVVRTR
jgi:DNA-binding beta-propeller fold protein YncE